MGEQEPYVSPPNLLQYAREAAARHPMLDAVYRQHLADEGEILPTLYLADVVRVFVPAFMDPQTREHARGVLQVMEEGMVHDDPEVVNMVAVGFVETLPYGNELGTKEIWAALPPRLRASWEEMYGLPTAP